MENANKLWSKVENEASNQLKSGTKNQDPVEQLLQLLIRYFLDHSPYLNTPLHIIPIWKVSWPKMICTIVTAADDCDDFEK